ncbi:hypothetical protein [Methylomonas sp. MgM2]
MFSRLKRWYLGLPSRRQDHAVAAMILAALFLLSSPPIAPYFWTVFWLANILFWTGATVAFVVGLFLWAALR